MTVTKVSGHSLMRRRRLTENTVVEFKVEKDVTCASNSDCSNVNDDVIVDNMVNTLEAGVDAGTSGGLINEIEEAAEEEGMESGEAA